MREEKRTKKEFDKKLLDDMAQNTNGEDEMFGEVGPRKPSLSFSAAKDDRFLDESQHQPKLSLSMFAADDIDEKPFKQDTKSF